MINVNFRIVGIYFGSYEGDTGSTTKTITVQVADTPAPPTVYDVMRAVAVKAATGGIPGVSMFSFSPPFPSSGQDLADLTVEYTTKPRSDRPYPEGMYILEDSRSTNPNKVLQYYIVDSAGVQKNRNNNTAPFSGSPDAVIAEGDTIIWRQVSICVGPNGSFRARSIAQRGLANMMNS